MPDPEHFDFEKYAVGGCCMNGDGSDPDVSCKECGTTWGVYSVGCSSTWMSVCQICEQRKPVTESRDYAYFATGIYRLQEQLKKL